MLLVCNWWIKYCDATEKIRPNIHILQTWGNILFWYRTQKKKHIIIILFVPISLIVLERWLKLLLFGLWQQEAAGCDPLDELYDTLAEVVGAEDTTECYKSYMLVPTLLHTLINHCVTTGSSCLFSSFVVNFSFGSFWASLVQLWIKNVAKTIQRLRDTGVEHFWLFTAGLCPAAGWRRCQPAGERSSDLRGNHRPGDLGGCALPGRVGSGSPAGLHWKVTKPPNHHENFSYSITNDYCHCWLFYQLIVKLFGLLNVRKCWLLFLRANKDVLSRFIHNPNIFSFLLTSENLDFSS